MIFQIMNLWFLQDWFKFSVFIHPALQQALFHCYGDKLMYVLWSKNEAKTFLFVVIRRLHIQKIMEDPYLFPDLPVNPTNRVAFQPRNHATFQLRSACLWSLVDLLYSYGIIWISKHLIFQSSDHLMVLFTFWSSGIVSVFRLLNLRLYISWTSVISVSVQMGYLKYSSLCDADSWAFNMSFKWCIFSYHHGSRK